MNELFSIHVIITGAHSVESPRGQVNMILFEGSCDCDFFHGTILPGGVDTQRDGGLSARYMLEGLDDKGTPTKLFIENNGKLHALVVPDYATADAEGVDRAKLPEIMQENLKQLNAMQANYEKVVNITIYPIEFEKTPKKSIKRYLYNANTVKL